MADTPLLKLGTMVTGADVNIVAEAQAGGATRSDGLDKLLAIWGNAGISEGKANTPSVSVEGTMYRVGASASGAFAGFTEDNLAERLENEWKEFAPIDGLVISEKGTSIAPILLIHDGTNWSALMGYQTLVDGANIDWDVSLGASAVVTLGGDRTFNAPTKFIEGQYYTLRVDQDGTGTRLITWNGVFKWAGGTAPTLSTGVNDIDWFTFTTDGTDWFGQTHGLNYS